MENKNIYVVGDIVNGDIEEFGSLKDAKKSYDNFFDDGVTMESEHGTVKWLDEEGVEHERPKTKEEAEETCNSFFFLEKRVVQVNEDGEEVIDEDLSEYLKGEGWER